MFRRPFTPALLLLLMALPILASATEDQPPLKLAVIGLHHGHANGLFRRLDPSRIELVGISEPDAAVREKYRQRFNLDPALFFADGEAMLKATRPQAAAVFSSTLAHREAVEWCAPLGIHVMVEKPLATTLEDARTMADLARKHGIHLLTNYETTWHPTTQEAIRLEAKEVLGPTRKVIVNDGHRGPVEIGVPPEFEAWLLDPVRNGGGALMDFGCYGANIITHMMEDERPLSVTAVTQTIKPEIYTRVEDEATIILSYPQAQGIIQASWNWPISRKDIQLYGKTGAVETIDPYQMRLQVNQRSPVEHKTLDTLPEPYNDPFLYFRAVVQAEVDPSGSLSSLENALLTMEILDAARESAQTHRTVFLHP